MKQLVTSISVRVLSILAALCMFAAPVQATVISIEVVNTAGPVSILSQDMDEILLGLPTLTVEEVDLK